MGHRKVSFLERLRQQGFDRSYYAGGGRAVRWVPRCSQCEVLVICGVPTHETGCPNIVKEEDDLCTDR